MPLAAEVPAKCRPVGVKSTVAALTSAAYDRGVLPDDLSRLVDLVTTPNHLDQASLAAIAKNLYPVGRVSDQVVLRIVGCLGHGQLKPSLAVQALLLRWIVLAYHLLSSHSMLSRSYSVLFNLLDTAALRSVVSPLSMGKFADGSQAAIVPPPGFNNAAEACSPFQDTGHV